MNRIAAASRPLVCQTLESGVLLACEPLAGRRTCTLLARMLVGVADEPEDQLGVAAIVEQTLSKGTARYDGRGLADAFDAIGATWSTLSGRQSTVVSVTCLPEYLPQAVELVAEMLCRPTFPEDAVRVAVQHAVDDLKHMEDDPGELLRRDLHRITLGPVWGRYVGGEIETLQRLTRDDVHAFWQKHYVASRLQVAVAGAVEPEQVREAVGQAFAELPAGDGPAPRAEVEIRPARHHRAKELNQQYIGLALPGVPRGDERDAVEDVLLGVLSGGMSGRLFTEVREKRGLVYWVGAWCEKLRGPGIVNLGASTTPQRCHETLEVLLRELSRAGEDISDDEVARARNGQIARLLTESDLTRARAIVLSEDLFFFDQPRGVQWRIERLEAVTTQQVRDYAAELPARPMCVATVGPAEMSKDE